MNALQPPQQANAAPGSVQPAGSAAVIVAEGYYRIKAEHDRLKELCAIVEPWAAHHACNNSSVSRMAYDVYQACVEMRRIIYSPNDRTEPQPPTARVAEGKGSR